MISTDGISVPYLWHFDTDPDLDPYHWLTDTGPALFVSDLQDVNKKFICSLLFEGWVTSFFKDNKSQRSHKTVKIKAFLTIFAWWQKDQDPNPDPFLWLTDPGGPKTYGSYGSGTLDGSIGSSTLVWILSYPDPCEDLIEKVTKEHTRAPYDFYPSRARSDNLVQQLPYRTELYGTLQ
jgi:hypothetical protein